MEKKAAFISAKPTLSESDKPVGFPGVTDGWTESLTKMLDTQKQAERHIREYIRSLSGKPETPVGETEEQKYLFGQLVNEVLDKQYTQGKPQEFVNASVKLLTEFMSEDFLISKQRMFSSWVDEDLYKEINYYTSRDSLLVLVEEIETFLARDLQVLKRWGNNLDSFVISQPKWSSRLGDIAHSPTTNIQLAGSQDRTVLANKAKELREWLIQESCKLEDELSILKVQREELRQSVLGVRGTFEKPGIDISAKVKFQLGKMFEVKEKLLFTMQDQKEVPVHISIDKLQRLLLNNIYSRFKVSPLKVISKSAHLLPSAVYTKYLSESKDRVFTKFDLSSEKIRKVNSSQRVVLIENLDELNIRAEPEDDQNTEGICNSNAHPALVDFYLHLLQISGQSGEFIKIVTTDRKLSNVTISRSSLEVCCLSLRADFQGISHAFLEEVLALPQPETYFQEIPHFPAYFLRIITESIDRFEQERWLMGDSANKPSFLHPHLLPESMTSLLTSPEHLDRFNERLAVNFVELFKAQSAWLEFEDYYQPNRILEISNLTSRIRERLNNNLSLDTVAECLGTADKVKLKGAFWVQHSLLFKLSQPKASDHASMLLLKDQMKHPQIETWLNLLLNTSTDAVFYDLQKFTEDLFELIEVNPETLTTEKKLAYQTLESYTKLLLLRSRSAVVRLLSYTNFGRSIQKSMNLKFLELCEQSEQLSKPLASEKLKHLRKHHLLRQSKMFDAKDYEAVRSTFDEDVAPFKSTDLLASLFPDLKYTRLVSNPGHKPFLFSNPCKGGPLGGSVPGMMFQFEDDHFDQDRDLIIPDGDPIQSQRNLGGGKRNSMAPDHLFADDTITFLNGSEQFQEQGPISLCPLVQVQDSTGSKILYDASVHDAFEIIHDISCLVSFFLENDLAYFQDDQFEDLDIQFESNQAESVLTTKNFKSKIPYFEKHFNYEYLVTRMVEAECLYQSAKTELCNRLYTFSHQVADTAHVLKLYELITDTMSKRPNLDLHNYEYLNENLVEWLNRINLPRDPEAPHRAELHNLVTTIFDNYRAETSYLKNLDAILEALITHQQSTGTSLDAVFNLFSSCNPQGLLSKPNHDLNVKLLVPPEMNMPQGLLDLQPQQQGDLIADIIGSVQSASEILMHNFVQPSNLDRVCFANILFDFHFKDQIDCFLNLPREHSMDFLGVLNDFMNTPFSRYQNFTQQMLQLVVVGEMQDLLTSVLEHKCADKDDLALFEGDLLPTPTNSVSVVGATVKFFKSQRAGLKNSSYSDNRGCNIINREQLLVTINQYFAYWLNLNEILDVRESLVEAGFLSQLYKAQQHTLRPVYESLSKNLRFEKPDDMLHTTGNLLEQFLDLGDQCKLTLDDVRTILKEDLIRGSNQSHHLSRITSLRRLMLMYTKNLSMLIQSGALTEKIAECEIFLQASKVLSNKESVMEHLYKFDLEAREDRVIFTAEEVFEDYKRGEFSFKYHLHKFRWSFIQIVTTLLHSTKVESSLTLKEFMKSVRDEHCDSFKGKESLMFGYDPEETGPDGQISHYFHENLFESQEAEHSSVPVDFDTKSKGLRLKLNVLEIPNKECKFDNITLTIECDPFVEHISKLLRRSANFLGIWLQSRKLIQSLYDKTAFMSFNPSDVVYFYKEPDLTFSKLQPTVMKILQFKHSKYFDDPKDKFGHPPNIFDEYGSLKSVFKIPTSKGFRELFDKDLHGIINRAISPKEMTFFCKLELFVFKKSHYLPAPLEKTETSRKTEQVSQEEIVETSQLFRNSKVDSKALVKNSLQMRDFTESYLKEILTHLKRLKTVEIDEINRSAPSSLIEKLTPERVLSLLGTIEFKFGRKNQEFGHHIGFASDGKLSISTTNSMFRKAGVDRAVRAGSYDFYHIEDIQETDLFIFYSQTSKLLDTVSVKLLIAGLDMDAHNMQILFKKSMPFYTLNSLRLKELDQLLFNSSQKESDTEPTPTLDQAPTREPAEAQEDDASKLEKQDPLSNREKRVTFADDVKKEESVRAQSVSQHSSQPNPNEYTKGEIIDIDAEAQTVKKEKFEYRKLRQYLYIVKRIELKNRSAARSTFTFVDDLKEKMSSILEDAKLTKPDLVFNTYLNCLFENEQRILVLGFLDIINQLRWIENFTDMIDINLEKIKSEKELIYQARSVLTQLFFKKNTSLSIFLELFSNPQHHSAVDSVMAGYPFKRPSAQLQETLGGKKASEAITRNHLLNILEKCFLLTSRTDKHHGYRDSNRSFNSFVAGSFDMQWEQLFSHLLSFRSPQRTFLSKKIFDIKLYTERNISMPKESIMPHNLWIYKCLDAHRLLDLNLKNLFLVEVLHTKFMNDLYCDKANEERASVQLDDRHMNGVRIPVIRRQYKPALLPFLTNSMFSQEPTTDFCRMMLRLMSTELRMTSFVSDKDLRLDRFPDLNFDTFHPESMNSHQVLDQILKKQIIVDSVWADEPLDMQVPVISHYGALNSNPKLGLQSSGRLRRDPEDSIIEGERDRITTDAYSLGHNNSYSPGLYNDHKVEILKSMVDTLRTSFFLPDVAQASTMCYLLMREFMKCATSEEISQSLLVKESFFFKSKDCQEKDKLIVACQKNLLSSIVKKAFVLENVAYGDQIAIKKSTLHSVLINWNNQVSARLQDELARREHVYLRCIDGNISTAENYQLEKDLVDFYFKHTMKQFSNIVNSRLAFRNSSFVCELDALMRFCQNIKFDVELMFDKIKDKLVKKTSDEIRELRENNRKLKATHLETVKKLKQELTDMIDQERQATLERMK